jgi:hypothetical protein
MGQAFSSPQQTKRPQKLLFVERAAGPASSSARRTGHGRWPAAGQLVSTASSRLHEQIANNDDEQQSTAPHILLRVQTPFLIFFDNPEHDLAMLIQK